MRGDVQIKELWKYEEEYVAALQEMKIDVNSMVDVPFKNNDWEFI